MLAKDCPTCGGLRFLAAGCRWKTTIAGTYAARSPFFVPRGSAKPPAVHVLAGQSNHPAQALIRHITRIPDLRQPSGDRECDLACPSLPAHPAKQSVCGAVANKE